MNKNVISYDTETTGLHVHQGDSMFSFSTCSFEGVIDVKRLDTSKRRENKERLKNLMEDYKLEKVCHNVKFDFRFTNTFLTHDYLQKSIIHDTAIQAHIINNKFPNRKLKYLSFILSGYPRDDEAAVHAIVREGGNYSHVPVELMNIYQQRDAERTMLLHRFFYPMIEKNSGYLRAYKMEMELIKVTAKMENRGIKIDVDLAKTRKTELDKEACKILKEIQTEAGWNINPQSSQQVQELLYTKLKLPVLAVTKKAKKPAVDKTVLNELFRMYPKIKILRLLQKYISRVNGSDSMSQFIHFADSEGIIHPNINTCAAITNRESCSDPNLQNIQKVGVMLNPFPVNEREVFIPRNGYVHIHIDYSGIELRLLVHFAREEKLIKVFEEGGDPHRPACLIFFKGEFETLAEDSERFKTLRGGGKNSNFMIPYGGGAKKLTKTLNVPLSEAVRMYNDYKLAFPKLVSLNKDISRIVREDGHVITPFGRKLECNPQKAYTGLNMLVQGTAGEILKHAQVRVAKILREEYQDEIKMLLPIHDEIIFEYPRKELKALPEFIKKIRNPMIEFPEISVPLDIGVEMVTRNWSIKKKVKI